MWKFPTKNHGFVWTGVFNMNGGRDSTSSNYPTVRISSASFLDRIMSNLPIVSEPSTEHTPQPWNPMRFRPHRGNFGMNRGCWAELGPWGWGSTPSAKRDVKNFINCWRLTGYTTSIHNFSYLFQSCKNGAFSAIQQKWGLNPQENGQLTRHFLRIQGSQIFWMWSMDILDMA